MAIAAQLEGTTVRRRQMSRTLALAFVTVVATSALAAQQASAQSSKSKLNTTEVVKVFNTSGIKMANTAGFGLWMATPVYASVTPHDGWTVSVSIYSVPATAATAYKNSVTQWKAAGIASAQVKNLIIAVSPANATIGHKAKAFPMPKLVAGVITKLAKL